METTFIGFRVGPVEPHKGFLGLGFDLVRVVGFRRVLWGNIGVLTGSMNEFYGSIPARVNQDLPCTLNWGYMVPNSRYLGPNRG